MYFTDQHLAPFYRFFCKIEPPTTNGYVKTLVDSSFGGMCKWRILMNTTNYNELDPLWWIFDEQMIFDELGEFWWTLTSFDEHDKFRRTLRELDVLDEFWQIMMNFEEFLSFDEFWRIFMSFDKFLKKLWRIFQNQRNFVELQ